MNKRKNKELFEQPLFENIEILAEDTGTEEEKSPYKLLTITGTASKGGFVNRNGRLYPTSVLVKATEKAQDAIRKGKLLGEVDHPQSSGSLGNTAIKFTRLYMQGDDMLFEGDVLATKAGEHLALLLHSGVGVGISTRGYGSIKAVTEADRTVYEVQPDFELKGIDGVLEESNEFGKVASFESIEGGNYVDLNLETLKADYPDLVKQIEESATAEQSDSIKSDLEKDFELKVSQAIEEKKEDMMADAKKAVMESDEIKNLQAVVESVITAVKPLLPEAKSKEDLDADLVKANESLQSELDTLNGVVKALNEEKANAEKALLEQEEAKKVAEKVNELVEGHRFEKALRQKLEECTTVESVQERFTTESEFINSLVENTIVPTGAGIVPEENENELNEDAQRQRRLAGLFEGGKE